MTDEVVHDDPHSKFLAGVGTINANSDVAWRIQRTVIVLLLISAAVFMYVAATKTGVLACIGVIVVLCVGLFWSNRRLLRLAQDERLICEKYLNSQVGSVFRVGLEYQLLVDQTPSVSITQDDVTYQCDLHKLAQSAGKEGWTAVHSFKGSLDEVVAKIKNL